MTRHGSFKHARGRRAPHIRAHRERFDGCHEGPDERPGGHGRVRGPQRREGGGERLLDEGEDRIGSRNTQGGHREASHGRGLVPSPLRDRSRSRFPRLRARGEAHFPADSQVLPRGRGALHHGRGHRRGAGRQKERVLPPDDDHGRQEDSREAGPQAPLHALQRGQGFRQGAQGLHLRGRMHRGAAGGRDVDGFRRGRARGRLCDA